MCVPLGYFWYALGNLDLWQTFRSFDHVREGEKIFKMPRQLFMNHLTHHSVFQFTENIFSFLNDTVVPTCNIILCCFYFLFFVSFCLLLGFFWFLLCLIEQTFVPLIWSWGQKTTKQKPFQLCQNNVILLNVVAWGGGKKNLLETCVY